MIPSFEDITGAKANAFPTDGIAAQSRSFGETIEEAFRRGGETIEVHTAIHQALEDDDPLAIQAALYSNTQMQQGRAIDALDGNFLQELLYKSTETIGQIVENVKAAGFGATVGAGAGAVVGGVAGLVIPTIGEEPLTVGAGAWAGAKLGARLGSTEASALMSFREGRGGMYAEMIKQGVSHETAKTYSAYGAIPYALIETLQVATAIPGGKQLLLELKKKTAKKFAGTLAKKYAASLGQEIGEEVLQELVQVGAEDLAKVADDMNVPIDAEYLKERGQRLLDTAVESAKAFALVPLPASAIEASIAVESSKIEAEMVAARERVTTSEPFEISVEDMASPHTKLQAALDNSVRTINAQETLRKEERSSRFGEVSKVIKESSSENWLQNAKRELKGEYTALSIDPISDQINPAVHTELMEDIRTAPSRNVLTDLEAVSLGDAYQKLYTEGKPMVPSSIKYANKLWGENVSRSLTAINETFTAGGRITDILSLPKTIAASGDLSAIMRQNAILIGNPKQWLRSAISSWKGMIHDEKTLSLLEKDMLTSPEGQKAIGSGIVWNNWKANAGYGSGTEQFASHIARRIPFVQRSSRAYAYGLNVARFEMFKKLAKNWDSLGRSEKDYRDLAHVVNVMTGEAPSRTLRGHSKTLNALFFAPRLLEARIRSVTDMVNPSISKHARKVLAWQMVKFVAINASALAMLSNVKGVEVERDPRSADFGKVKIGQTRIDFWGGYLPLARTILRLIQAETKTQSGQVIPQDRLDTVSTFLQSKLGPVPSAALDFMRQQNFIGEEIKLNPDGIAKEFYEKFTPFFLQDIIDATRLQGLKGGMLAAPFAFHGAGVSTYPVSPSARVLQAKDQISMEVLGKKWDTLGSVAQEFLRDTMPEIEQEEMKARFEYSKKSSNYDFLKETKATSNRIRKSLYPTITKELDRLNMTQGLGISRNIGSWRMPDTAFKQYEKDVTTAYNKILWRVIKKHRWAAIPDQLKVNFISDVMSDIKAGIRENIVAEANTKDFKPVETLR